MSSNIQDTPQSPFQDGPSEIRRVLIPVSKFNFDENGYLEANPDVADAVKRGAVASGRDHYETNGHYEQRSICVDPEKLLPFTLVTPNAMPSFSDLAEEYPQSKIPWIDRDDVDETKLTRDQLHWRRFGALTLPGFIPKKLTDAYLQFRDRSGIGLGGLENSVHEKTAQEVLDIGCFKELSEKIVELFGEELHLNFTLSQFTSTQREWHQDDYLGSPNVFSRYCAAWIAVDDVHPDSGPFEWIPGSHRWPGLRGHLVRGFVADEFRYHSNQGNFGHWAEYAECFTTPAIENEIDRLKANSQTFHPRRGDVLLWHGKLIHRGTRANVFGMRRPALICHYYPQEEGSAEEVVRHGDGGTFFRRPR